MRDLLTIIIAERKTLVKGFTISFLLILPFTFLPVIINNGFTIPTILGRLNLSILYSLGFALIIIIASLINNYNGLFDRQWYFNQPAFKSLNFYGRLDGVGSIVNELESILLGKIGTYFFRLNLIDTDKRRPVLEIVPLIKLEDKANEIEILKLEYKFRADLFFGMIINLKDIDLENPTEIQMVLSDLSKRLEELKFESLEIDENQLEKDVIN